VLTIYQSNRMEALVEALAGALDPPPGPLAKEWIAVKGTGMRAWLTAELAVRFGVWASGRPVFPRELVERVLRATVGPPASSDEPLDRESLPWAILRVLPAFAKDPRFNDLTAYAGGDPRGVRAFQLASRIAGVFDEYALYRPDMILEWEEGRGEGWQPALWRELFAERGSDHFPGAWRRFMALARSGRLDISALPTRISLFGLSTLPPAYMDILAAIPVPVRVNLFVLTPTREYWADLRRSGPQEDCEAHPGEGHPMLASCGRLGRDLQTTILDRAGEEVDTVDLFEDRGERGMLGTLQSDMLNLRVRGRGAVAGIGSAPVLEPDPRDRTIVVNSCHGPIREVEVLKDQLLELLDDPALDLTPDDVLVLAPDMGAYAPLVEAVFSARDGGQIPFRINHRRMRDGPVAEAFFAVLGAARGRVALQDVFDLLMMDPIRARFEMSAGEVEEARRWMAAAGVRWGIDEEHRRTLGQPAVRENTWMFGLDRLLLGYAMPPAGDHLFCGVLPSETPDGGNAALLGRVASFVLALLRHLGSLSRPRPLPEWSRAIAAILDDLMADDRSTSGQRQGIIDAVAQLEGKAAAAGFEGAVDLDVVREALLDLLGDDRETPRSVGGGVSFGSLVPFGGIPARVICLLGMNDADFPRSRRLPGFDLTAARPRPGDRSVRNDDLFLFLEALLGARDRLIISCSGQSNRSNRELPPSVLVAQLLDVLDRDWGPAARDRVLVRHPLQGFSPAYFDGAHPRLFSYSEENAARARGMAASVASTGSVADRRFVSRRLPPEGGERPIRFEDLLSFFGMPARRFVSERLGIRLSREEPPVDPREPMALDALQESAIGQRTLDAAVERGSVEGVLPVLMASGLLPHGTSGRVLFDRLSREVLPMTAAIRDAMAGGPLEPIDVDLSVDTAQGPARIVGSLGGLFREARVVYAYGKVNAKRELRLWVEHLALSALAPRGCPTSSVMIVRGKGRGGEPERISFPPPHDPVALLSDLVELYLVGSREPLRFLPELSRICAEKTLEGAQDPLGAVRRAISDGAYHENACSREIADPAVTLAFRGVDIFSDPPLGAGGSFAELAVRVFEPVLAHLSRSHG